MLSEIILITVVSDIAMFVLKRDVKLQLTNSYHGTSPVLTATVLVNEERQILTPTESALLNWSPKSLSQTVTSATPTPMPNLTQSRPWRFLWKRMKCNKNYIYLFIYTFFVSAFRSQTPRPILMCDGSRDTKSPTGVPFGYLINIAPCSHCSPAAYVPRKPHFGGINRHFSSQTGVFVKYTIISK